MIHRLEILIAFTLSAYVTYMIGVGATLTMFTGWFFANAFEYIYRKKD